MIGCIGEPYCDRRAFSRVTEWLCSNVGKHRMKDQTLKGARGLCIPATVKFHGNLRDTAISGD